MYWPFAGGKFGFGKNRLRAGRRGDIMAGAPTGKLQVPPPSVLISVKTSKKLSMWNRPSEVARTLVRPSEARVGLSRIITPAGRVPPERLSDSISVSKNRVGPES